MEPNWRKKVSKCFVIPQRYIMAIMGSFALFNAYTMRTTLSIAITEMIKRDNKTRFVDTCPIPEGTTIDTVQSPDLLFDWDEQTQGLILSSFYWGYFVTHLPGGFLAEKFGGKYLVGIAILTSSLFTIMTPWIIQGVCEGTAYPAINAILAQWIPPREKSTIGSLINSGAQLGSVVSILVGGIVISKTKAWTSVFYLFGSLGIFWFVVWQLICYSNPAIHPFISDREKEYLKNELVDHVSFREKSIPWAKILTSEPVWALIAAEVGHDWCWFTMVMDLPKYMKNVLKFGVKDNALWSSLPFASMWVVSLASGFLCDVLINRGCLDVSMARKLFTTIGAMGPGCFLLMASYAGCDRMKAVAWFTLAMGLMGTHYCGMKVNVLDLSPNFAGVLMAVINGIGVLTGIITPLLVGFITPNVRQTLVEWNKVFWMSFFLFAFTTLVYLIFGSGEEQPWNKTIPRRTSQTKIKLPLKQSKN